MKTLLLAASALALSQTSSATEIVINLSEAFSEDLTETYGTREADVLRYEITKDIDGALTKAGADPARIEITIVNAKPNRPTLEQARQTPGLDMFRSVSLGGMKLTGTAFDADGNVLAEEAYKWFETDIRQASPAGTWTDAKRASDRFARRLAKQLSPE